ncbi:MAG: hypothetical protein B9S32_04295 [Verrucomicrobia bacterium Tous-C9LFEB]|nr:MAG: hypothetical protein B9S32_04295 [Verrucomicrobia bacterium Tous-C9LFEB]
MGRFFLLMDLKAEAGSIWIDTNSRSFRRGPLIYFTAKADNPDKGEVPFILTAEATCRGLEREYFSRA